MPKAKMFILKREWLDNLPDPTTGETFVQTGHYTAAVHVDDRGRLSARLELSNGGESVFVLDADIYHPTGPEVNAEQERELLRADQLLRIVNEYVEALKAAINLQRTWP